MRTLGGSAGDGGCEVAMSGGSYDYAYSRVAEMAHSLRCGEHPACPSGTHEGYDEQDRCRRCQNGDEPGCYGDAQLRLKFREHLNLVAQAMRAIEWDDSGDGDRREADLIRACLGGSSISPSL